MNYFPGIFQELMKIASHSNTTSTAKRKFNLKKREPAAASNKDIEIKMLER
jgi:hypothetical protein